MEKNELIHLKADDIQKATLAARKKSMQIFGKPDIIAIAQVISEFLAPLAERPEMVRAKLLNLLSLKSDRDPK